MLEEEESRKQHRSGKSPQELIEAMQKDARGRAEAEVSTWIANSVTISRAYLSAFVGQGKAPSAIDFWLSPTQ
jgi:hypothetical protein